MNTEAALGHQAATPLAGHVPAIPNDTQAREIAGSLLDQGKSPADVWEALISSGVQGVTAEAIVKDALELHRQAERVPEPITNVYAPPIETPYDAGLAPVKSGSFGLGLGVGLLFSLWTLVVSFLRSGMGSETKRGIRIGFGIRIALTVVIAMAAAGAGR